MTGPPLKLPVPKPILRVFTVTAPLVKLVIPPLRVRVVVVIASPLLKLTVPLPTVSVLPTLLTVAAGLKLTVLLSPVALVLPVTV